jgi:hypothetical protein
MTEAVGFANALVLAPSTNAATQTTTTISLTSSSNSSLPSSSTTPHPKEQEFHSLFTGLDDEALLYDFSCALYDKIRYHGRLYISKNCLAFTSDVFGTTKLVLPVRSVRHSCITAARSP